MTPNPVLRTRLAGSLFVGLTALTGLALSLPARAATPRPVAHVQAQADVNPVPARLVPRASRGGARTALPAVRYVTRTVAVGPSFSGRASWYGGQFQGHRTASGERFNTNAMTAASKTLPFGTRLRVCRRSSCVVVRINDRGPFVRGRVLDLSRAASRAIGSSGVAYVTATPIGTRRVALPAPKPVAAKPAAPKPAPVEPVVVTPAPAVVLAADETPSERPSVLLTAGLAIAAGGGFLRERRRSYAGRTP